MAYYSERKTIRFSFQCIDSWQADQAIDENKNVDINKVPFVRGFVGTQREKAEKNIVYKMYEESSTKEFSVVERLRFERWTKIAKEKGDLDAEQYHKLTKAFSANQKVIDFGDKYDIQDKSKYLNKEVRDNMREFGVPSSVVRALRKDAEKEANGK